jgi:signal transduction histidine kinase/ActR/RegA family two-component response regulator
LSIRHRLLLLVLGVWLPAVVGFALLAYQTYQNEQDQARRAVEDLARGVNSLVEGEIDKRALPARVLAASAAIRDGDMRLFQREADRASEVIDSTVGLVDAAGRWVDSPQPVVDKLALFGGDAGPPLATTEVSAFLALRGADGAVPTVTVYAPQPAAASEQRFNVAVTFAPAVLQAIVDRQRPPPGTSIAVIDGRQRIVARNRDPRKWIGAEPTGELRRRAQAQQSGFAESITLDGVPTLSYLSPGNRYGWQVVIGLPQAAFTEAARRLSVQALTASAALLLIGLAIALYNARAVGRAVHALRRAAVQLGEDRVPPMLKTGVHEADEVGVALHEAGVRSHEATRVLEHRVAEAVRETEEAQSRLLESRKHEAIGRLTGGLAHDFNNLLQTISSALELLDHATRDSPQGRVVQAATRACGKAADLVRQMLAFGRVQPLRPEPVDVGDFLLRSQHLAAKAVGEKIRLSAQLAPELPTVVVDPTQLELAMLNLLFNARDALVAGQRPGGSIVIAARSATASESEGLAGDGFVCLEVTDNGPGMDQQTQARAFDPYYTTKPKGAGSGLGLAQVLAFARQSGGDVRLRSELGVGTTVCLVLPAGDRAAAGRRSDPAEVRERPEGDRLSVLIVEDDPLVSAVVVPALEHAGHCVTLCATADEAQRRLAEGLSCDVLFTDIVMPGRLNGLELVDWCRLNRPTLPAVVATGYSTERTPQGITVLGKPYAIDALLAALQTAARSQPSALGAHASVPLK